MEGSPFGGMMPDGRIDVRCLNGEAWDRSVHPDVADDVAYALAAAEHQAIGVEIRRPSRP